MRHIKPIYSHQNRIVLSFALVLALLVQGILGASGSCLMAMDIADTSADTNTVQTISHEGHEGHDMGATNEPSDDDALTKTRGHICPPDGCDICDGGNCSQCDPSQYSLLAPQGPIFLKDIRSAIPELPRAVAFVVSRRHWSMPPGRAPPALNS